jgi:hypothetical protein
MLKILVLSKRVQLGFGNLRQRTLQRGRRFAAVDPGKLENRCPSKPVAVLDLPAFAVHPEMGAGGKTVREIRQWL